MEAAPKSYGATLSMACGSPERKNGGTLIATVRHRTEDGFFYFDELGDQRSSQRVKAERLTIEIPMLEGLHSRQTAQFPQPVCLILYHSPKGHKRPNEAYPSLN